MKTLPAMAGAAAMIASGAQADARAWSQATVTIHAPVETVWALVVDIDGWPRWNKAVQAARLKGPLAPGAAFDWKSGGMGIRSTFREIAPMRRLVWTGKTIGTNAVHAWTFAATDKGVVVTTSESFDGWLPAIMPRAMQKMLDDTLPALLASLKVAAEAQARGR